MCEKRQYKTYQEAQKIVSTLKRGRSYRSRKNAKKIPKRVYKCDLCGMYHITSQLEKNNRKKRRNTR